MGTRRSRHNKGRKRKTYRDFVGPDKRTYGMEAGPPVADQELVTFRNLREYPSRYIGSSLASTGLNWSDNEHSFLTALCEQRISVGRSAEILGRSETSIAHRARHLGLSIPQEWASLITKAKIRKPREAHVDLQYPYIITKRDEHADLLAVNDLVPKRLPSYVRADICQEAMVAVFEGRITIEQLRANKDKVRWFISQFYKNNYEDGGRAISLSGASSDGGEEYDLTSSWIARDEWRHDQMNDKRRSFESISRTFYAPTQIDDVFARQVSRKQFEHHVRNELLSFDEVEGQMAAA